MSAVIFMFYMGGVATMVEKCGFWRGVFWPYTLGFVLADFAADTINQRKAAQGGKG